MSYPGFDISDNIVGKSVTFDTVLLERFEELHKYWDDEIPPQVRLASEAQDAVECVLDQYYKKNPEIRDWYPPGGTSFKFPVREADIQPLLDCIAHCIVLQLNPGVAPEFSSEDSKTILYSDFITEDLDYSLDNPDWTQLDDSPIEVEKEIQSQIPDGYESVDLTGEKFREYVFDILRPEVITSDWPEGGAWSINLALHVLRKGRYREAAYAFSAVRNSITKSPTPFEELDFDQLLNKYLITLRDLSLHHSTMDTPSAKQERFVELSDRPYVYVPIFASEPTFHDPYFRMSSPIWIANALTFTAGLANALGAPTISRSEVDPFGSEMTFTNTSFVLRAAKELVEINENQTQPEDPIGYLEYIDFSKFAPETVLSDVFESIGYENLGTIRGEFKFKGETIPYEPDLALEREGSLYLVYYQESKPSNLVDFDNIDKEVSKLDLDVSFILVSESEFPDSTKEKAENSMNIELFYLDTTSKTLRSVDAGLPVRGRSPVTKEEIRERLRELYDAAESADDSQNKGNLLEEFTELLFNKLIPDTEVLRVNSETVAEEFDLVLRNDKENEPWTNLSSIIMVECKNWSSSVGASIIHTLNSKADILGSNCSTGILISWNGITGSNYEDAANQRIRELKQQNFDILHFDSNDLDNILESQDPNEILDRRYIELVTEY